MQGTNANPIDLDLDQAEAEEDIEQQLEVARKKQLIEEAKLSRNGTELALAVIKTTIKGELKVKNKTLNRAIIKYFQKRLGINISCQHFHPRKDPDYENNPPNPLEFLLYGVDFLSTTMIHDRFKLIDTTIQQITWINNSCCKVIFKTESEAKMVLDSQVIDKQTLQFKQDEQSNGQLQGWFTLRPYYFYNFQRQLIMRYSTQNEHHLPKEQMDKYKEYENASAELLVTLFEEFKAHQAYEQVMKEIDREELENRLQHRRSRRNNRYFGNRQPQTQRRERSRTRDKKYNNYNNQRKINQHNYERDRNTSFEFRSKSRESRVTNMQQNFNHINTSFQMKGGDRSRHENHLSNTSFEMRPHNQNISQNRQHNATSDKWQRNSQRRPHAGNSHEFEAKVVHQVFYQHQPVDQRQMSNQNSNNNNNKNINSSSNNRWMGPPRKANAFYDWNGVDDQDNLSFSLRSYCDQNNQESDHLEEMSLVLNQKLHNKSKQSDKKDISFQINSINYSKEDYVHNKSDYSFKFNKQLPQNILNKSLNDSSFLMDPSKAAEKGMEEKEKVDFNQLFHLQIQEEISPIHQQNNDTSFEMRKPDNTSNKRYSNNKNDDSYLDFKKPIKQKKKEILFEDDDGY